ncbi:hemolysin family protein [Pelistega europaea]|uniref:HlyC/CorC family transporter n=1 Tax=Pelistega europaea TaxID=106147 RepID=A0A7Y4LA77_9BURK|nr:hemolysin family protein [Pelistega europaea]NOL48697.1 HlyC/CorC family transporter [Pelistega europaea]
MLDLFVILFLIFINGLFAMSEIAVVSSKRLRLQKLADEGSKAAKAALNLADEPSRFLSTVQIGITLIGIFNGAFGEASLVSRLVVMLEPVFGNAAYQVSLAIVVIGITLASLILGELVPKRIAMHYPERVAMFIALPMTWLSRIVSPFVWILSISTDFILRLFGMSGQKSDTLTEEDISGILNEGATAGLFEKTEHEIVARALSLDDKPIAAIMTPRSEVHYIDINAPLEETLAVIADSPYSRFPVVENELDNIIGLVDAGSLFEQQIRGEPTDIRAVMKPARFVPETISAMDLLETLQQHRSEIAIVINEYGEVEGVVTLRDILKVLVGNSIPINEDQHSDAIQRKDGSWLIDGTMTLDRFREVFNSKLYFPDEELEHYHTLAGFVMHQLGHIPKEAESITWQNFYIEVVDMDKHRIDRLLVKVEEPEAEEKEEADE